MDIKVNLNKIVTWDRLGMVIICCRRARFAVGRQFHTGQVVSSIPLLSLYYTNF